MIVNHIKQSTPSHLIASRSILILFHIYAYVFEANSFIQVSPLFPYRFSPTRAICPAHRVLLDFGTNREGARYKIFSIFQLLLPLSWVQISSSAPCSRTPSAYVLHLMLISKFHAHIKQQVQLQLCIF